MTPTAAVTRLAPTPAAPPACTIADHEALKRQADAWDRAPLCGYTPIVGDVCLEMRQCPACGSTLSRGAVVRTLAYLPDEELEGRVAARVQVRSAR